jgi:hypothetical protein
MYMLRAIPLQTEAYSYLAKENRVLEKKLLSRCLYGAFSQDFLFYVFRRERNHDSRIYVYPRRRGALKLVSRVFERAKRFRRPLTRRNNAEQSKHMTRLKW